MFKILQSYLYFIGFQITNMLDNAQYWNSMKKITSVIDKLEIQNDSFSGIILQDDNLTTHYIQPLAFPSNNLTINSCFTINLHSFKNIKTAMISYQRDINIYFHYPGQFFYTWRNELNKISSSTKLVIDAQGTFVKWYDLNVNMAIEKYKGLYKTNTTDYDTCIEELMVTANESVKDFILPSHFGNMYGNVNIDKTSIMLLHDILQIADMYCSDPTDTVRIQTIEKAMVDSKLIPLNYGLQLSNYSYTEEITMDDKIPRPKIIMNFPKFTKKMQVRKYVLPLILVFLNLKTV